MINSSPSVGCYFPRGSHALYGSALSKFPSAGLLFEYLVADNDRPAVC